MTMLRKSLLLSLLALATAGAAYATPALDSAGKCRDNGKFVDAKLCATPAPAAHCRDTKTKKYVKCGTAGSEPVPTK
jgi:hypothetical protein